MNQATTSEIKTSSRIRSTSTITGILAVLFIGGALRLDAIGGQIVADDELHALRVAASRSYGFILSHFGHSDHCIPLTLFYKTTIDLGLISEWTMRAPVLLFGIFALLVCPWTVRKLFSQGTTITLTALLAISPTFIYYSRYARPYMIASAAAFVGILALFRWFQSSKETPPWIWVTCAILAPYFHLTTLPMMLMPPILLGFWAICKQGKAARSKLRGMLFASELIALGLVLLLGVPFFYDGANLSEKVGGGKIGLATIIGSTKLSFGTHVPWIVLPALFLLIWGVLTGFRKQQGFTVYLLLLGLTQVAATILVHPSQVNDPVIFLRYCLPCLFILLSFFACGIDELDGKIARITSSRLQGATALFVLTGLFLAGPIQRTYFHPNNWTNHAIYQYSYHPKAQGHLKPELSSEFYNFLRQQPRGSLRIVEAPWYPEWSRNVYGGYQEKHRQTMLVGFVGNLNKPREGELSPDLTRHFKNYVWLDDWDRMKERRIDFVILHKNLAQELPSGANVQPEPVTSPMTSWMTRYQSRYSTPFFEDSIIMVFDLRPSLSSALGTP